MKARILRLVGAVTAGAALIWCWRFLTQEPEQAPQWAVKTDPAPRRTPRPDRNPPPPAPWPKAGTAEFNDRVREKGNAWLDARGRDSAGLIALWDLTHDEALLNEAAKRFPNDPLVCRAMIEHLRSDSRAAMVWIEQAIASDPENPAGQFLRSWAEFQSGNPDEAFAALCAGLKIGRKHETYHRDRTDTLEKAMAACDLPPREAALTSLRLHQNGDLARLAMESAHRLVVARIGQISGPDAAEQLQENLRAGNGAIFNNGFEPRMLADEVTSNNLLCLINNHLPDDWELTKNFISAGWRQWASDEEARLPRILNAAKSVPQRLESASDDIVVEYARFVRARGESWAIAWILENTAPQQPSAPLRYGAAAVQRHLQSKPH